MISYTINVHAYHEPRPVVKVEDLAGCGGTICLRLDDLTIFSDLEGLREIRDAIKAYFVNISFGGGLESEEQPVEVVEQPA